MKSAPYPGRSTNVGVASLAALVFAAGCTAEAIALDKGSEIALVLQQIFGVASAVTVCSTLFVLTPLGSRLFSDAKVQIFDVSGGDSSVAAQQNNPTHDGQEKG